MDDSMPKSVQWRWLSSIATPAHPWRRALTTANADCLTRFRSPMPEVQNQQPPRRVGRMVECRRMRMMMRDVM